MPGAHTRIRGEIGDTAVGPEWRDRLDRAVRQRPPSGARFRRRSEVVQRSRAVPENTSPRKLNGAWVVLRNGICNYF